MKKFNINNSIKVKLLPKGVDIFYHQYDHINENVGKIVIERSMPKIDVDGYTSFQMHHFMNIYGKHLYAGAKSICETEILFNEEDLG